MYRVALSIACYLLPLVGLVADEGITTVTEKNYAEFIGRDVAVIKYHGKKCPYSKQMAPIYEQLANQLQSRAAFGEVEVNEESKIAGAADIKILPTFVVYKKGVEVKRRKGASSEDVLKRFFDKHL